MNKQSGGNILAATLMAVAVWVASGSVGAAGSPKPEKVAYLGVVVETVDETLREQLKLGRGAGVRVERVAEGSAAEKAGLKAHDVLEKLNDQSVFNRSQLVALIRSLSPGAKVTLTVIRQGDRKKLTATLGETEAREEEPDTVTLWNLGDGPPNDPRVQMLIEQVLETTRGEEGAGKSDGKPVGFLGVGLEELPGALASQLGLEEGAGVLVTVVTEGSPAEKAGLRVHDVITRLDGKPVKGPAELSGSIRERKKGDRIQVAGFRAGKAFEIDATLDAKVPEGPVRPRRIQREFRWMPGGAGSTGVGGAGGGGEGSGAVHNVEVQVETQGGAPGARVERRSVRRTVGGTVASGGGAGTVSATAEAGGIKQVERKLVVMRTDAGQTTTVTVENGERHVTVEDAQGKVVFDGPVNTEEEKLKLPADVRENLEKIERQVEQGEKQTGGEELIRELRERAPEGKPGAI